MSPAILIYLVLATFVIKGNLICTEHATGIDLKDKFVEGYSFLGDIDHGEQHCTKIATQEKSKSKIAVVSLSQRTYLSDKEPIEATCINSQIPSFQGRQFPWEDQISNVVHEQSALEVLQLQTIEKEYRAALHDMSDGMAFGHRQDLHPWCKVTAMASRAKYLLCAVAIL